MKIHPIDEEHNELEVSNVQFAKLPAVQQAAVLTAAVEYEKMNQQEKLLKARRDKVLRPIIEGAANAYGVEDDNGSLHLDMGETEVVRTKKISRTLNSVAAEDLLKSKGLYDSCVQVVMTYEIDEEKIIEAYNAGRISAGEIDSLFSEKITWALSVKTSAPEVKEIEKLRKEIERSKKEELPEIEST